VYVFRETILATVDKKLTSGLDVDNDTFILMAASMYLHQQVKVVGNTLYLHTTFTL